MNLYRTAAVVTFFSAAEHCLGFLYRIILSRTVKQGDLAAAGSPMAVLAQPEALCVHASIDEQYIDRVGTGQSVSITFTTDTGEERTYTGSVRRVEETGVTSGGVTDYTVEIALDNTEGLRDGMNVSVSILTEGKEDCLRQIRGKACIHFSTATERFNVWGMPFFAKDQERDFDNAFKGALNV